MKVCRIAITPLSPIHIGCGEEFEPTNCVIDTKKSFLYAFNPANIVFSTEERAELFEAVNDGDYKKTRHFFASHLDKFRCYADAIFPLDNACVFGYGKMLNPSENQKDTEFTIFRTAYVPALRPVAYLPGSCLKGIAKTALADFKNNGEKIENNDINQNLFGGDFKRSPFRFLKVSDFYASSGFVQTSCRCAARYFKSNENSYSGEKNFFETIEPAQYRVFSGIFEIADAMKFSEAQPVVESIEELLKKIHKYAFFNWRKEFGLYRMIDNAWTQSVDSLLREMSPIFDSGKAALIRIGKNTGAESKVLLGKNVAKIRIRHKPTKDDPNPKPTIEDHTTTMFFCSSEWPEAGDVATGLPFGWAICELIESESSSEVQTWCEKNNGDLKLLKNRVDLEWNSVANEKNNLKETTFSRTREPTHVEIIAKEETRVDSQVLRRQQSVEVNSRKRTGNDFKQLKELLGRG